jgi:hypothetical protein
MIGYHFTDALAAERRRTLLAEAAAARQAKQARLYQQRTGTFRARRSPLHWVRGLVGVRAKALSYAAVPESRAQ